MVQNTEPVFTDFTCKSAEREIVNWLTSQLQGSLKLQQGKEKKNQNSANFVRHVLMSYDYHGIKFWWIASEAERRPDCVERPVTAVSLSFSFFFFFFSTWTFYELVSSYTKSRARFNLADIGQRLNRKSSSETLRQRRVSTIYVLSTLTLWLLTDWLTDWLTDGTRPVTIIYSRLKHKKKNSSSEGAWKYERSDPE